VSWKLARKLQAMLWQQLELFKTSAPQAPRTEAPRPTRKRHRPSPEVTPIATSDSHWRFTRPWHDSPHLPRARRELDFVRAHFPELDGVTIDVGMTKRRTILGLAAMGARPALWIRPRRIHRFVIAHELVHLLQARGLAHGGEKAADLYALARATELVDVVPFYLAIPQALRAPERRGRSPELVEGAAAILHAEARAALAANKGTTARGAVRRFENALHAAHGAA